MQVGKQFDALLVDTQADDAGNPVFYTFPSDPMAVSFHCSLTHLQYLMVTHGDPQTSPGYIQQLFHRKKNVSISLCVPNLGHCLYSVSIVYLLVSVLLKLCLTSPFVFITGHH